MSTFMRWVLSFPPGFSYYSSFLPGFSGAYLMSHSLLHPETKEGYPSQIKLVSVFSHASIHQGLLNPYKITTATYSYLSDKQFLFKK